LRHQQTDIFLISFHSNLWYHLCRSR